LVVLEALPAGSKLRQLKVTLAVLAVVIAAQLT